MWLGASSNKQCEIYPAEYGYSVNNDSMLVPVVMEHQSMPDGFPFPCKWLKCAREKIRRVNELECCEFCNCKMKCRNPRNSTNKQN